MQSGSRTPRTAARALLGLFVSYALIASPGCGGSKKDASSASGGAGACDVVKAACPKDRIDEWKRAGNTMAFMCASNADRVKEEKCEAFKNDCLTACGK